MTLGKDGPKPSRGDRLIGTFRHGGVLEVGDSYEAETTVNIPTGLTGQYFLTVYADGYGGVYEAAFASNVNPDAPNDLDGSNYGSTPINVLLTPPADLRVAEVIVPTDDDGTRSKSSAVKNCRSLGPLTTSVPPRPIASRGPMRFTSRPMTCWTAATNSFSHCRIPDALQPGESYTQEAEFTLPPTARGSHVLVQTNVDPRIALTNEDKFLDEVKAVLQRIEAATGKPLGETKISDLKKFSQAELREILAGPTNTLQLVYEGPFTDNNVGSTAIPVVDALTDLIVEDSHRDAERANRANRSRFQLDDSK